ncbi:MAG: hypothetical protein U0S12_09035 [Fimbriimonadales bacterium]
MLKSDANERLVLRGRVYARHRLPDSTKVPALVWLFFAWVMVLNIVMTPLAAMVRHSLGRGPAIALLVVSMLLVVCPLFLLRFARRGGNNLDESVVALRPAPDAQLVRASVRLEDKVSYGSVGWLTLTEGRVRFLSQAFDFDLGRADLETVGIFDGRVSLSVPKNGPVRRQKILLRPMELRDGRVELRRDEVQRLKDRVAALPVRPGQSLYPPIEMPESRLDKRQLGKGFLGGCVAGCLFALLAVAINPPRKDPWWVMVIGMSVVMGLLVVTMNAFSYVTYRGRAKQIEKWSRS